MQNIIRTFTFDDASEYVLSDTRIDGGVAKLGYTSLTGQHFTQDFSSDSGFTYDSTLEFNAGVLQQKENQLKADQTFSAAYTSSIDAVLGLGNLTGTAYNGAAIVNNRLDLSGNVAAKYVTYDANLNADSQQTGTLMLKIVPNYTGSPTNSQHFIVISDTATGTLNLIDFYHNGNGNLYFWVKDQSGTTIVQKSLGNWYPTAGTAYFFQINYDFTLGKTNVYMNGTQVDTTITQTCTRSSSIGNLMIGKFPTVANPTDFFCEGLVIYSSVQTVASDFPAGTLPDAKYSYGTATLPDMVYGYVGDIQTFSDFTEVSATNAYYTLNGKYYNGSAWVTSDESAMQTNTGAEVKAHINSLDAANTLSVKIFFPDGATQGKVDNLDVEYVGQQYITHGFVEVRQEMEVQSAVAESITSTLPASTEIKGAVYVDGYLKYWDGSAWVDSDGTVAQCSSIADLNSNLSTLLDGSTNKTLKLYFALSTSDQQATPELDSATFEYDFGGVDTDLSKCIVYGYYKDISGAAVSGATVEFKLKRSSGEYKEATSSIIEKSVSTTTDANGYFEIELIRSSEYEGSGTYIVTISKSTDGLSTKKTSTGQKLEFEVPDALTKDITELFTAK